MLAMRFLVPLCFALTSTGAYASSDASAAELARSVAQTCADASGFEQAQVSQILGFDDTLGMVAALVTGIHPQAFMNGARGNVLCIYDKRTGRTWLDEAAGWSAPDLP